MEFPGEDRADFEDIGFLIPIAAGPTLETLVMLWMAFDLNIATRAQSQRQTRTGSDLSLFVFDWERVDTASLPIDRRCMPITR